MHVWDSVKKIQFLCERLDFSHICFLKKFMFLHRLLHRLDNAVLKQCFVSYSQSVEFASMCYDFDVIIDICIEQDISHKIFEHFSCAVKVASFSVGLVVRFSITVVYLDSWICLLLYCLAWLFCLFLLPVMANKLHHCAYPQRDGQAELI